MSTQPEYVSFEPNAREQLLSRLGSFSPLERTLFQRLCESWAPVIDRNRFLSRVGGSEQETMALDRLMAKLRNAQLGMVTSSVVDGKRVPVGIVLGAKGDLTLAMALLDEETSILTESGYRVLPSIERLDQRKAVPSDMHITDADSVQLAEAYLNESPEDAILRVRLLADYRILVASRSVKGLISSCLAWLRSNLEERGFLDELARIMSTTIMELKSRLGSTTPDSWLELARTIVRERSTIAFRKNLQEDDELFQVAFLMMNFTDARIGVARAMKEKDTRVDDELAEVASAVESVPGGRMDGPDFTARVEETVMKLGSSGRIFADRLNTELLIPPARRKLPVIANLGGVYMHRNRVGSIFEAARKQLAARLREIYTDLMESFLRGRSPELGEVFASRSDLDLDMAGRVEREDPLMAELLAHPQMLAEAVIRQAKISQEGIGPDEVRVRLASYFNLKNSSLLPITDILQIDIVPIYDAAYARINVFRQIMLRFSGRHESLRKTYLRRFGPGRTQYSYADNGEGGAPRGGRTRTEREDTPGMRTRGTGNRDYQAETASTDRKRRVPTIPPKPRMKSPGEVERAWQDFGDAIQSKPEDESDEESP